MRCEAASEFVGKKFIRGLYGYGLRLQAAKKEDAYETEEVETFGHRGLR